MDVQYDYRSQDLFAVFSKLSFKVFVQSHWHFDRRKFCSITLLFLFPIADGMMLHTLPKHQAADVRTCTLLSLISFRMIGRICPTNPPSFEGEGPSNIDPNAHSAASRARQLCAVRRQCDGNAIMRGVCILIILSLNPCELADQSAAPRI